MRKNSQNQIKNALFLLFFSFSLITITDVIWQTSKHLVPQTQINTPFKNDLFAQQTQSKPISITPLEIEKKLNQNHRWLLLIDHFSCPDSVVFKNEVINDALKKAPTLKIYVIDQSDYASGEKLNLWNSIIGKKSNVAKKEIYNSPKIKNFVFKYTPSLLVIEKNQMIDIIEEFGGGEKYQTRYFRHLDDEVSQSKGIANIRKDFDDLIKKWK